MYMSASVVLTGRLVGRRRTDICADFDHSVTHYNKSKLSSHHIHILCICVCALLELCLSFTLC